MWWKKKKKRKCPCLCHFKVVNGRQPSEEHCESCKGWEAAQRMKRLSSSGYKRAKLVTSIDDIFSLIIRIKGDWTCVKCKRTYPPVISRITGLPAQNIMTNSHYYGRGKYGTRWDEDNCDPMCIFCHQKVENNKTNEIEGFHYQEYLIKKIGEQRFLLITEKSKMRMHYKEHQLIEIKERLKAELVEALIPSIQVEPT